MALVIPAVVATGVASPVVAAGVTGLAAGAGTVLAGIAGLAVECAAIAGGMTLGIRGIEEMCDILEKKIETKSGDEPLVVKAEVNITLVDMMFYSCKNNKKSTFDEEDLIRACRDHQFTKTTQDRLVQEYIASS
jgi:hypothetical protein